MKKSMLRTVSFLLAAFCVMPMAACFGGGDDIDETKTQLYIGFVDSGTGSASIYDRAAAFEKEYADWKGENGKVGVEVIPTGKLDEFSAATLMSTMPYNGYDIYYTGPNYAGVQAVNYKGKSILADITDVVTGNFYDDEGNFVRNGTGTKSLADRLYPEYCNYFNLGTEAQPSYWAIPTMTTASGIIYDADCFSDNQLYFFEDGTVGATQADIDNYETSGIGKGPDGLLGTYDDGMPATWEQFKKLLATMTESGVIPFVWAATNYQREYFFQSIYANYEGARDYLAAYTLQGEDDVFGTITEQNAWQLAGQEGKLAAYKAVETVMSNPSYYSEDAMKSTTTHTNAEMYFLQSVNKGKRIAMLLEGSWWEQESREVCDDMEKIKSEWGWGKRNFKLLPIPNFKGTTLATASETGGDAIISQQEDNRQVVTMTSATGGYAVISAQTKQLELAKEWLKFSYSREQLARYTQFTSSFMPVEYSFTPEEKAGCTKFTQNLLTVMEDENTDIVWDVRIRGGGKEANASYFTAWTGDHTSFAALEGGKTTAWALFEQKRKAAKSNWPIK